MVHRAQEDIVEKTRTASCCCGELSITLRGEPERVICCRCDYCQMRTGNVFQTSCWYWESQIESKTGTAENSQIFNEGPNNPGIDYTFCRRCGSTVYWEIKILARAASLRGIYGIAVGCFVDPDFPKPDLELYGRYRHHWIDALAGVDGYDGMAPVERMAPKLPRSA